MDNPAERALRREGELRTGPESIEVPISVYVGESVSGARLEFEAEHVAAQNRSIRMEGLSTEEVKRLRDALDAIIAHDR
jgi:hypothetical protein